LPLVSLTPLTPRVGGPATPQNPQPGGGASRLPTPTARKTFLFAKEGMTTPGASSPPIPFCRSVTFSFPSTCFGSGRKSGRTRMLVRATLQSLYRANYLQRRPQPLKTLLARASEFRLGFKGTIVTSLSRTSLSNFYEPPGTPCPIEGPTRSHSKKQAFPGTLFPLLSCNCPVAFGWEQIPRDPPTSFFNTSPHALLLLKFGTLSPCNRNRQFLPARICDVNCGLEIGTPPGHSSEPDRPPLHRLLG